MMIPESLMVDSYELAMMQAYFEEKMDGVGVFEFFVRRLPPQRKFLVSAGLEQALEYLENLKFTGAEMEWLRQTGKYTEAFLKYLEGFRFSGDVRAIPEGSVFFENEPVIQVSAPIAEAQFVETRLMNLIHFQTLIASKAARVRLAAPGKTLVDFGARRAHAGEAALFAARASYLAGFAGTSVVAAGFVYGIPVFGTMAHSYIEAHETEQRAFEAFARLYPREVTLLLDTYDTESAARRVARMAPALARAGVHVRGVRLDSGDLADHARRVRKIFDDAGLGDITLFASGGLDETEIARLLAAGARIDGFGVGTSLTTSSDAPFLDCAYKLQEYSGRPTMKLSEHKISWPGRKQIFRNEGGNGQEPRWAGDIVALESEALAGRPLLETVMKDGRRTRRPETLARIRGRLDGELSRLPESLKRIESGVGEPYEVRPSENLRAEAASLSKFQKSLNTFA